MLDVNHKARRSDSATGGPPLDFQQHLAALEARGLLVRIDRPINKDSELHPLVRWQFQGGLAEGQRRAFLFTNVVDAAGRRYDIPVVVGALAASPQIYAAGMGRPVEEIEAAWLSAIDHPIPPVVVSSPACQQVVITGDDLRGPGRGLARAAGAGLDAGLRRRALSDRDALRHARSRHRHPEHGHLSRPAQSHRPAGRAHGLAHRRRGRLSALAEAQEARHADAVRDRHRLRAGRDVHRRHEARHRSRRDGGGGRARGRADAHRQGGDRRPAACRPTPRS